MASKPVRLLDGSFAKALSQQGFNSDDHKLWTGAANKLEPEMVKKAYIGFLEAGVDIITTNTYHSLIPLIKKYYPNETVDDFNKPAIDLLLKAFETVRPLKPVEVIGSIGCYGASLRNASEYTGAYLQEEEWDVMHKRMIDYYVEEICKLERYDLKKLIIETVPAALEVEAILQAITVTRCEIVVSFSCKDGEHLNHGEGLDQAVERAVLGRPNNITGVGINCTKPEHISSLLTSIQGKTKGREIFVYPNDGFGGEIKLAELSEEELRGLMADWIAKGATVIGGCCNVGPEVISKMRKILDTM